MGLAAERKGGLSERIKRGWVEQQAITTILIMNRAGMPDDIAAGFIRRVGEGRSHEVLETLTGIGVKLVRR